VPLAGGIMPKKRGLAESEQDAYVLFQMPWVVQPST
jgi:hypothetical protein